MAHFRVVEQIGEGGMGAVWKAVDTRLDREVAIKILPERFANDEARLARFEREAKVLASLDHPGIAGIYGLEEVGGERLLVMELVPGTNLHERLKGRSIMVEDALEVARQVAEALEAAHESGVIHRDLKPANIQVTPEGRVKILDFGLAKALGVAGAGGTDSMSPTITTPATREGVVMGTAAYMSPEQAKGKPVDRRADIWAFGCVLYEMLTGRHPFGGGGNSEVLAAVIMAPVDLDALSTDVPGPVRRLLRLCLEKNPRRRLRDIGDARIVLEEVRDGIAGEPGGLVGSARRKVPSRSVRRLTIAASVVIVAAASAGVAWWIAASSREVAVRRFQIEPSGMARATPYGNTMSLSPGGGKAAWLGDTGVWVRDLDSVRPRMIATAEGPEMLSWSPDGKWIAYAASGSLWKVPAVGGSATPFATLGGSLQPGSGSTWGPGDRFVFARGVDSLYETSASRGGDPRPVLDPGENESDLHQPWFLPGGRGILYVSHRNPGGPDTIAVWTGARRKVVLRLEGQRIAGPRYAPSGHILYRREPGAPGIWALPFSLADLAATGEPFLVASRAAQASVSSDGTLAYLRSPARHRCQMVWVDRRGDAVATLGEPETFWPMPSISPDGRRVAVAIDGAEGEDVWIYDLERGTKTRLTVGKENEFAPIWSRGGDRIVYTAGPNPSEFTVWMIASDGASPPERIGRGIGEDFAPGDQELLFGRSGDRPPPEVVRMTLDDERRVEALPHSSRGIAFVQISPDGRYIAYASEDTGRSEIYIRRYPDMTGRWQVSTGGGLFPHWNRRGDELYYVQRNDVMAVQVRSGDDPFLGTPEKLFTRETLGACALPNDWPPGFDVTADGDRFLVFQPVGKDENALRIELVQNWYEEFRGED